MQKKGGRGGGSSFGPNVKKPMYCGPKWDTSKLGYIKISSEASCLPLRIRARGVN